MVRNFQAYELALSLHRHCEKIEARHSLKDQLLRASQSVVLNLAEGSGKPTRRDQNRFFAIAYGSVREVMAVFDILAVTDLALLDLVDHVGACIYRLMKSRP